MNMARDSAPSGDVDDTPGSTTQHRCLCCNGIITGLSDQDLAIGLDAKLGLVSDECGLICNDCTARLIQAAAPQSGHARRRR
jgi:hypothetical protein